MNKGPPNMSSVVWMNILLHNEITTNHCSLLLDLSYQFVQIMLEVMIQFYKKDILVWIDADASKRIINLKAQNIHVFLGNQTSIRYESRDENVFDEKVG